MTYFLILGALLLPLFLWLSMRWLLAFGPGQGSSVSGVTFQTFPSVIPVANTASGAAQTNTATLTGKQGKVLYIEGFDLSGGGATSAGFTTITVAGLAGPNIVLTAAVIAGATLAGFTGGIFSFRFPTPLPAGDGSGNITANSNITVAATTYGTGNTQAACTAYGFLA